MARRIRTAVVVLAALLVLAPASAARLSDGSHHHRSACQRLTGGRDLAPARKVRLVRRTNSEGGTDLLGCVLPKGKVRQLASSFETETSNESYGVRQVQGKIVLLDGSGSSQYGGGDSTYVFSIRTGRSYTLASRCYEILGGYCNPDTPNTTAPRAFVNFRGQAAASIASEGQVTIAGFSSTGRRTDLDAGSPAEIPASSLVLDRRTVSWSHSGEPRSAQLSG